MNREGRPTHWFTVSAFIFIGYLLIFGESSMRVLRDWLGAQIHFLPGMFVYAAVSFNVGAALGSAALLGLLYDSISANPLGITSMALVIVTFSFFHFRELILPDQFTAQVVLGWIASAAVPFLAVLFLFGTGEQPLIGWGSFWQWLIMTAGGGAVTPVWFMLFNKLDKALRYKEVPETSFRADREIARGRRI